jgi:hypothetical protein
VLALLVTAIIQPVLPQAQSLRLTMLVTSDLEDANTSQELADTVLPAKLCFFMGQTSPASVQFYRVLLQP